MEGDKKDALVQPPPEVQILEGKGKQVVPCHSELIETAENKNPILLRPAPAGGIASGQTYQSRYARGYALTPNPSHARPAFDPITPSDRRQRHAHTAWTMVVVI